MRPLNVAVLGAGGAVGAEIIRLLAEREFPLEQLRLLATARSAGTHVDFCGRSIEIAEVDETSFVGVDVAFFCATGEASRRYAPLAVEAGAVVIDKSNAFRMDPSVPLVVPEVNPSDLYGHPGIIASPNCSTIQMVVALKPLLDAAGLKRVIVSTYQAVSGSGRDAMEELMTQIADIAAARVPTPKVYPHQIALNLFPHIDKFDDQGNTAEELKMVHETRKILHLPTLPVAATCVRVPVLTGHSEAVYVETERPLSVERVRELLQQAPGVTVMDDPERGVYPTPLAAAGRDDVLVGRIRADQSWENGLSLWVVADNLRKGAATNAVQIAEWMLAHGLL